MFKRFEYNRMELAGAFGDMGTLLPIAIAMVVLNGLNPLAVFLSIGLFYFFSGLYYGITVPVQPMKVIGAYAIATAMSPDQIIASSLLMAVFLLLVGLTGVIDCIARITPRSVIRGVQLSTGALLISGGVQLVMGSSKYQLLQEAVEPHLAIQSIGVIPISAVIGSIAALVTLLLLENKKFPAALVVIGGGVSAGLLLGARIHMGEPGIHLPEILPFGLPSTVDFTFALFAVVIPQLPMTMGNAVLAYTDLSKTYFGKKSHKLTNRSACMTMACANLCSFMLGGIPLCHGAGGLAAHYAFGARTAGSNVMIGGLFIGAAILFGPDIIELFTLLPMSVLGVLLIFAGAQLTLTIMDMQERKDFFVATLILGITLASNLAAGFVAGMVVAQILRWEKLSV